MAAVMEELELSEDEIVRITRFRRPKKQLEFLTDMGIPAKLRRDNTVCVLRMHMRFPTQQAANDAPKRKSEKR